ncbi:MAG: hypothetical protein JSV89_08520 [Spirochaetaceae bacterium]|nr:MAG: hypothetical protein JSV89_08520 [Spirochaetaceae bacterium]
MKVGRGLFCPMSKTYGKCTSYGHRPFFYTATLIVLGLALVLIGCGELSLEKLLENEEPGELSISPMDAYIPASGTLDISGKGGFTPYKYKNIGTLGTIDPDTGVYAAPASVSESDTTDIEVTDSIGSTASTTITVFAPLSLNPAAKIVDEGQEVDFTALGGVPNYDFYLNGSLQGSSSGSWSHTFSTEGSYTMEVVDRLGNTAVSTITVEGHLAIVVDKNWVEKTLSLDCRVINPDGAHTFSIDTPGTSAEVGYLINPSSNPATFVAPDVETVVTIKVEDNSNLTTVEIHVLSAAPEPLAFPTTMTVLVNKMQQLTATGGIEPHTFWLVGEGNLSTHPTQENRIRYNAPSFPTTAYVWVQDRLGRQAKTTVNVVEEY